MRIGHVPAAVPAKAYELERLRNPKTAAAYLSIAARDDDPAAFLQALRNVTEAMEAFQALPREQDYENRTKGSAGRRPA